MQLEFLSAANLGHTSCSRFSIFPGNMPEKEGPRDNRQIDENAAATVAAGAHGFGESRPGRGGDRQGFRRSGKAP